MNFMNAMSNELKKEKTLTTNGAVAYATAGKEILDFNFQVTALRHTNDDGIANRFSRVYYENPLHAVKFLFWLRDCRGGNGERRIFRVCMGWLADNKPEIARRLVTLVPEYGRWDDLWPLLDTEIKDRVVALVSEQLNSDKMNNFNGKPISLLAKWLPSGNTSSKITCRYAGIMQSALGYTPRQYRKVLSALRKSLNVVEQKISANKWEDVEYQKVPSQANLKYNSAFLRHDEERRREYLESLKKGDTKINASTLQPHEIVQRYENHLRSVDDTLEELWKALPDVQLENALVVRDGSGSMTWVYGSPIQPLTVATALAIYMAEHNTGCWKGKFITFSHRPRLISLENCETLRDKLTHIRTYNECSNTNVEATMMLVLQTAIENNCTQEDLPKRIIICSDMQFDGATTGKCDATLFEEIAERFEAYGYKMPRICFWNLNARMSDTIPLQQNELGVVLASGFSVQLLNMFMSGETDPYKVLLEAINTERYLPVENAVKDLI